MAARLAVSGLPACLAPPLRLVAVEVAPEPPRVRIQTCCQGPSPVLAEVTAPLFAWVTDANGCTHCGNTQVVVCCRMPLTCAGTGGTFMATADIRLARADICAPGPVFDACLCVCVEVYMVRMEPCARRPSPGEPLPTPELRPMFPQPYYP